MRIVALVLTLALAGCSASKWETSVFNGGLSLTATVQNPVTIQQEAAVEVSYNIAAKAVLAYARLRRCAPGESAGATNLCAQGSVVGQLKKANRVAYTALKRMRSFIDNNQQISAVGAYNEAVKALRDFRAIASINNLQIEAKQP